MSRAYFADVCDPFRKVLKFERINIRTTSRANDLKDNRSLAS